MTQPTQASHFLFNSSLFAPKLRMMLRGIRVDQSVVEKKKAEAAAGVWRLQSQINNTVIEKSGNTLGGLWELFCCFDYDELDEARFARLVLSCLGGSNPRVRRDVTVERWQPMRWNGKKWVKDGKLTSRLPEPPFWDEPDEPNPEWQSPWLKPAHKTISRLQSFTPSTLADCEEHVPESKEDEWKRVKQIWKELKNEQDIRVHTQQDYARESGTEPALVQSSGQAMETVAERRMDYDGTRPEGNDTDKSSRSTALLGELSTLLGLAVNVGSTSEGGDSQWFLYEACGLPRMYCDARTGRYSRESETEWKKRTKEGVKGELRRISRGQKATKAAAERPVTDAQPDGESLDAGGQGGAVGSVDGMSASESTTTSPVGTAKGTKRLSTDQIALDRLYAHTQDVRVLWVLQQRRLRKVVCDLSTRLDKDGRLRASISLVKETGRMSESAAPTGCGLNRQALNKDLLAICIPDEGCEMARLDLEGADSWTVACEAAALGDSTMLDDLKAGIKPAQVVGLIYVYNASFINSLAREEITRRLPEIKQRAWLYPASKAIAHGTPYGMGWETLQMTLLKNSMSELPLDLKDSRPIVLSKQQIEDLREAFFSRYPGVKKWQEKVGRQLMEKGWLATSTGHMRRFYGRKTEISKGRKVVNHETWKEALASMPQYYTTYSIKQAWGRMWWDEENWRGGCIPGTRKLEGTVFDGVQIVEPLALKHDEILMQWRKEDREWAVGKLREWFRTPVTIAGIEVVIPAAGKIGSNWAMKNGEPLKL